MSGEIIEIAYQYGKCTRCGKDVTRPGPDNRWTDFYSRDRCRESGDDGQCDVARVYDGVRRAQIKETVHTTVILYGPGGEMALRQTIPADGSWSETLAEPVPVSRISVLREKIRYQAEVTP